MKEKEYRREHKTSNAKTATWWQKVAPILQRQETRRIIEEEAKKRDRKLEERGRR